MLCLRALIAFYMLHVPDIIAHTRFKPPATSKHNWHVRIYHIVVSVLSVLSKTEKVCCGCEHTRTPYTCKTPEYSHPRAHAHTRTRTHTHKLTDKYTHTNAHVVQPCNHCEIGNVCTAQTVKQQTLPGECTIYTCIRILCKRARARLHIIKYPRLWSAYMKWINTRPDNVGIAAA